MRAPFMKSAAVAVALVLSTLAHAAELDAPGVAGRISLAQGDVSLESAEGGRGGATLNWPVTDGDVLRTAPGARTEVRVGSTAIRLDGDSSMEVVRLDEETVRLRLFYGSVNVRVRNRELLDGFELSTPQGNVRMAEPGRIRVNAERAPQTTELHVFEGVAVLAVPGSTLTVREGRSAQSRDGDVLTGAADRDGFDDWAYLRDLRDDRAVSTRYVPREMTGYEELDQYGSWRDSADYGPLWIPRSVPVGWVPYSDGRWTWVAPWGWTWVDNAPWGYAPSHYGRWVMVGSRWGWAPGRNIARPVWAPALVGWVGGANWSLSFGSAGHRHMPAQGWYPLTPHDAYVPHYRARRDHVSRINYGVRPRRDRDRDGDHGRGHRPPGLTVVPQEHFGIRNVIEVSKMPKAAVPVAALPGAGAPPSPRPQARAPGALDERRRARRDELDGREFGRPVRMAPPVMEQRPAAAAPVVQAPRPVIQPGEPARHFGRRSDDDGRFNREQRDERDARFNRDQRDERDARINREQRGERDGRDGPRRSRDQAAPIAVNAPLAQPVASPAPEPQAPRRERERERERERTMPAPAPVVAAAPPPVVRRPEPPPFVQRQQPAPPPVVQRQEPAPQPQVAPPPPPQRPAAAERREERRAAIKDESVQARE